jgi:hypothetical protein
MLIMNTDRSLEEVDKPRPMDSKNAYPLIPRMSMITRQIYSVIEKSRNQN